MLCSVLRIKSIELMICLKMLLNEPIFYVTIHIYLKFMIQKI